MPLSAHQISAKIGKIDAHDNFYNINVNSQLVFIKFPFGYTKKKKGDTAEMDEKRERQFRELGLTISYYRKLKGLTQLQLANAVGLSRTHISNIEAPRIKTSLSLESLFDIADALDIQPRDLFNFREQQQQ